jgi:hypothetical protein
MRRRTIGTAAVLLATVAAPSQAKKGEPGITLTVYNPSAVPAAVVNPYQARYQYQYQQAYGQQGIVFDTGGYAVVTERRKIQVAAGQTELRFADVPAQIDPTTVHFVDETDPSTVVSQQRFVHDLASVDALLARYVGKSITVVTDDGERTGTLVWYDASQFLIKSDDPKSPMQIIQRGKSLRDVRFGDAAGLTAQPTLIWAMNAKKGGEHLAQVTYQTRGISWSADYNVVLSSDEKKLDVTGWLSIVNNSGVRFADAALRLIAGDVAREAPQAAQPYYDPYAAQYNAGPPKAPPLYQYDIPGAATIDAGATKQVEIFGAEDPALARAVVYEHVPRQVNYVRQGYGYPNLQQHDDHYGTKTTTTLESYLEITSGKAGQALPPGRVRVYKRNDKEGTLELVSEGRVDAGPQDQGIRVKMGTTTDIAAERTQTGWRIDDQARELHETFEIKLRNSRKEAVEVLITEHMWRWTQWTIQKESTPVTLGAGGETAQFRLRVPASGNARLEYTVVYQY